MTRMVMASLFPSVLHGECACVTRMFMVGCFPQFYMESGPV